MLKLINAPYISQKDKYPTGCESISAVMLLQFLGYEISPEKFIDNYLKKTDFWEQNGVLFGADPKESFCGSPYDENSFGCYAPVIAGALKAILKGRYSVIDETGKPINYLVETYIEKGMPVIMWTCINMREPVIGPSWYLKSGEEFTWISNEHCMLFVGYDEGKYYFNDPYDDNGVIAYEKHIVIDRHKAQHMQAVGIKPE